ncbi:MAG: DUF2029 domain-containing protein [Acidobacteria bacterium]|nr:DUF2029 domain-containing protein [Acidobacteriota bacterium]
MVKRNLTILAIFTFICSFSLCWGLLRARAAKGTEVDYKVVYIGARCLLRHCDPYNRDQLLQTYFHEGGEQLPPAPPGYETYYLVAEQLYPPSAELFFAPFALFNWSMSYSLWVGVTFLLLTACAFLIWTVASRYAPDPPFYLTAIILANSGIILATANPAGIAVSLCIIGAWCLIENRMTAIGVLCLAISLAIKPHDTLFIWAALFLAGSALRKKALQSLALLAVIVVVASIWFFQISPHWMHELQTNIVGYSTGGTRNDPAGATAQGMVNLQPLFALIRNEPRIYNFAALAIWGVLFLAWILVTLHTRRTRKGIWLGIAAMACLTLLPVYHRYYDAKILILTLPACAALWEEGGISGWTALTLTSFGVLVTSDLPFAAMEILAPPYPPTGSALSKLAFLMLGRPPGLVICCLAAFYVWAYARFSGSKALDEQSASQAALIHG